MPKSLRTQRYFLRKESDAGQRGRTYLLGIGIFQGGT
jgi:hypothetical protein